ncbi:TPA: hypothetical protein ENS27_15350 [bacterium]|nr:hypothetical protein [bacterium]
MVKRFFVQTLILFVCFMIISEFAYGQSLSSKSSNTFNAYFLPYFQNWKMTSEGNNDQSISQFSMPLFVNIRPTENLRIWLVDAFSTSSYDSGNGENTSLSGISDAKIKASYSMFDRRFLVTLGANLPLGKGQLNNEEFGVANVLYNEILGFRVNKLGGGFDINAGLGYAESFGPWGLSISSSFLKRGSYQTAEESETKYKPGDEIGVVTALDMVTDTLILNGDLSYINYGKDKFDSEDSFKEGDELKARLITTYRLSPVAVSLSVTDTIRMKSQKLDLDGKFVAEEKNSHGNKLDINVLLQYLITRNLSISPLAGLTLVADNGYGENGAFIWNAGGAIQYLPTKNVIINLNAKSLMGNMKSGDIELSGFETGIVLIARF